MTKADKIRALAKRNPSLTTAQIGARCGCLPNYVRVVLRQRVLPGGRSKSDIKYNEAYKAEHGVYPITTRFMKRYHSDPEFRAEHKRRMSDYQVQRYREDEKLREAKKAASRAYYQRQREGANA